MTPYNELSDRDKMILDIWDGYKDAYGVRHRHVNFEELSDEALEEFYSNICNEVSK